MSRTRIGVLVLAALIVLAHAMLWLSDMPQDAKARLTLLNAAGWAVVLLPALAVNLWLGAVTRRNDEG